MPTICAYPRHHIQFPEGQNPRHNVFQGIGSTWWWGPTRAISHRMQGWGFSSIPKAGPSRMAQHPTRFGDTVTILNTETLKESWSGPSLGAKWISNDMRIMSNFETWEESNLGPNYGAQPTIIDLGDPWWIPESVMAPYYIGAMLMWKGQRLWPPHKRFIKPVQRTGKESRWDFESQVNKYVDFLTNPDSSPMAEQWERCNMHIIS